MTDKTTNLLQFDRVGKRYHGGHDALSDLSFVVDAGEVVFLTGHSGAGKSTLLKLIHGGERASRGAVLFEQKNLAHLSRNGVARHRQQMGVVFQDHRLLLDRTIYDNVALPLIIRGFSPHDIGRRVRHVLERVGLADRERAYPVQLSTGEAQRIGIARAIVSEPKMLLADEPTGNLDPELSQEIMGLLVDLAEKGTCVMIASHDLMLVRSLRKRVLVLDHGTLVDDFRPAGASPVIVTEEST